MTAVPKDLTIEQGTTFVFAMTLSDTDVDPVTGDVTVLGPKDLTGADAWMQIRKAQGAPVQWEGTVANGKIVFGREAYGDDPLLDDPTNGRLMVIISDEDTDALTIKSGLYDLELVEEDPRQVTRLAKGKVTVDPNITQQVTGDVAGTNDEVLEG